MKMLQEKNHPLKIIGINSLFRWVFRPTAYKWNYAWIFTPSCLAEPD